MKSVATDTALDSPWGILYRRDASPKDVDVTRGRSGWSTRGVEDGDRLYNVREGVLGYQKSIPGTKNIWNECWNQVKTLNLLNRW